MIDPQIQTAAVVLIGKFNPAIFSPAWLLRVGLIKEADADGAEVRIIHSELSVIEVASLEVQVATGRLTVSTNDVPLVRLQEFVSGLMGGVLTHTPVEAVGLNFEEHFIAPSPAHRLALGRLLAPVEPWGDWGKAIDSGSLENPSGLTRLAMQENSPAGRDGAFTVEIAPSDEIKKFQAVMLKANDHYPVVESKFKSSAEVAATIVDDNFEISQKKAWGIFQHIRELAEKVAV